MKRVVYAFSTVLVLMSTSPAIAQSVPPIARLTPLQRQQISRDLVPSSAQDFFSHGQANLEQEIDRLIRPRSSNEPLLKVSQNAPIQPDDSKKNSLPLQPGETK